MQETDEIKRGDYVRIYDFPGRYDCFVDGWVKRIECYSGCDRYVIQVTRQVFGGEDMPVTPNYESIPPVNGTLTAFGDITVGVKFLAHPAPDTPEEMGRQIQSGLVRWGAGPGFATIDEMKKGIKWYPDLPLGKAIELVREDHIRKDK